MVNNILIGLFPGHIVYAVCYVRDATCNTFLRNMCTGMIGFTLEIVKNKRASLNV